MIRITRVGDELIIADGVNVISCPVERIKEVLKSPNLREGMKFRVVGNKDEFYYLCQIGPSQFSLIGERTHNRFTDTKFVPRQTVADLIDICENESTVQLFFIEK